MEILGNYIELGEKLPFIIIHYIAILVKIKVKNYMKLNILWIWKKKLGLEDCSISDSKLFTSTSINDCKYPRLNRSTWDFSTTTGYQTKHYIVFFKLWAVNKYGMYYMNHTVWFIYSTMIFHNMTFAWSFGPIGIYPKKVISIQSYGLG